VPAPHAVQLAERGAGEKLPGLHMVQKDALASAAAQPESQAPQADDREGGVGQPDTATRRAWSGEWRKLTRTLKPKPSTCQRGHRPRPGNSAGKSMGAATPVLKQGSY
jgi:hypothetical protein